MAQKGTQKNPTMDQYLKNSLNIFSNINFRDSFIRNKNNNSS